MYRSGPCNNCSRHRVELSGVCDKCLWDNDAGDYACITRPQEFDTQGRVYSVPDNDVFGG